MLRKFLTNLKQNTVSLNYGRDIISSWAHQYATQIQPNTTVRILDIGMGPCADLELSRKSMFRANLKPELHGIDTYTPSLVDAKAKGVNAKFCNIEKDTLPYPDRSFDLVIANQIIEHTKEIFWIFSEVGRVLKPGGLVIIGVPNLASFHNRIALLFGIQPTSIEVFGPHVRGFTAGSLKNFLEVGGHFMVEEVRGSNFYPFPQTIAKILARLFPRSSVSIFLKVAKTDGDGAFTDILKDRPFETPYYTGPNLSI